MTTQHVFYVDPKHPCARIHETAFFTRKAAERVKLAHLQKLAEQQPSYFNADRVFHARQILKDYREKGTLQ